MADELTSEQLGELETDLRTLQAELEHMIDASAEGTRPVDLDQPIGRVSRIDAIQQQKMLESNRRSAKVRLRLVQGALNTIANGDDYGLCTACEEPIAFRRLKAKPESRMCIECKSEQESRS